MKTSDSVIEITELTKDYQVGFWTKKTVRALDHLSLDVRRGEIFGFLGPNGAGKTTTLKLLMRLIFPTSGNARILGKPIHLAETHAFTGYLPENPYFYDYLSGRELLVYTAALFGVPKAQAQDRAVKILRLVGLDEERANRQLRKYSKGMLQRVGIAQALINDPEIIFMDEPMSGLDPIGRREVRDLMLSLREKGKTILFSSHILSDVEALCDRAAVLSRGRLVQCGTVQELTGNEDPAFEIVAIGIGESRFLDFSHSIPNALSVTLAPSGVHLIIKDESAFPAIISLIHKYNGKVLSINPKRASLEDVFSTDGKGNST